MTEYAGEDPASTTPKIIITMNNIEQDSRFHELYAGMLPDLQVDSCVIKDNELTLKFKHSPLIGLVDLDDIEELRGLEGHDIANHRVIGVEGICWPDLDVDIEFEYLKSRCKLHIARDWD